MNKIKKYTIWHGQELNISRNFGEGSAPQYDRLKYFRFSGINKNDKPFDLQMNNKQMKEFEQSIIKKIVKRVCHIKNI